MKLFILILSLTLRVWGCNSNYNLHGSPSYINNCQQQNPTYISPWNAPNPEKGYFEDPVSWDGLQLHDSFEVIDYSRGCPNTYEPLCATNDRQYLYFKNHCFLHEHNFEELMNGRQEFSTCPMNLCFPQCRPCSNIIKPVCARDLNTQQLQDFKNYCEMEYAGCSSRRNYRFQYPGSCFRRPECPRTCTKLYQPVCAHYGKEVREFLNYCELQRSRCESKIDWTIIRQGSCTPVNKGYEVISVSPICAGSYGEKKTFPNYYQLERETQMTGRGGCLCTSRGIERY